MDICPGGNDKINSDGIGMPDDCDCDPNNVDSDLDLVPDCLDICPGGNDRINSDGMGMPDDCDCDPNNPDDEFIDVNGVDNLGGRINFGLYQSSYSLSSIGKVQSGGIIDFKAGYEITLNPGFAVEAGSNFTATIEFCISSNSGTLTDSTIIQAQKLMPLQNSAIDPITKSIQMEISPNPFKEQTTIRYKLQRSEIISIGIYNQLGQFIDMLENHQFKTNGNHEVALNRNTLKQGLYFIVLHTNHQSLIKKVVLQ